MTMTVTIIKDYLPMPETPMLARCFAPLILTAAVLLFGCDQPKSGNAVHHWKLATKLVGGTADQFFVVIEPDHMTDDSVYGDAAATLCAAPICMIGFYADRNDVPSETYSGDFYNHGGWGATPEIAHFHRNLSTTFEQFEWNCARVPHPFLNQCYGRPARSEAEQALVTQRGVLTGYGKAHFDMTLDQLKAAIRPVPGLTHIGDDGDARTFYRTTEAYHDRPMEATWGFKDNHFRSLILIWKGFLDATHCHEEADKIARNVGEQFGAPDAFWWHTPEKISFDYEWHFTNNAKVTLSKLDEERDDCVLNLSFRVESL